VDAAHLAKHLQLAILGAREDCLQSTRTNTSIPAPCANPAKQQHIGIQREIAWLIIHDLNIFRGRGNAIQELAHCLEDWKVKRQWMHVLWLVPSAKLTYGYIWKIHQLQIIS